VQALLDPREHRGKVDHDLAVLRLSTLTSCLCARVFTSTQSFWKLSEARNPFVVFWTNVCRPVTIAGARKSARGGRACSALALTSTFANSVLVTLSAIAAWMRGSDASGLIVRT
jgi:hypothetical protein